MYCHSPSSQPRDRLLKPAVSQLGREAQWVPTPQSYNPSPSASKPASVAFPSKDSFQLPTPAQSTIPMAKQETVINDAGTPQFSGRGKRLTVAEEECLVRLCRTRMRTYDIQDYQKSFWIEISELLQLETGRSYSWQSCRRRMMNSIENRKAYRTSVFYRVEPPHCDMDSKICEELDTWMANCDAKVEMQRRQDDLVKRKAAAVEERQRLEADVHRKSKQSRVWKWVCDLPHADEMEPVLLQWGEHPSVFSRYASRSQPQSHSRSRSRSPRRDQTTAKYRERSRSPYGLRAAKHIDPAPLIEALHSHVHRQCGTVNADNNERMAVEKVEPLSSDEELPTAPEIVNRKTKDIPETKPIVLANQLLGAYAKDVTSGPVQPIQGANLPSTSFEEFYEKYMFNTRHHTADYVSRMAVDFSHVLGRLSNDSGYQNKTYHKGVERAVHGLLKDVGVAYINMIAKILRLENPGHA